MIRKLQKKIVLTTTLTLAILVVLGNLLVHVAVVRVCGQMTDHILRSLAENEEVLRSSQQSQLVEDLIIGKLTVTKEELFSLLTTPLYAAEMAPDGTLLCFEDLRSTSPLDPDDMEAVLRTVGRREAGSGSAGGFRYYKEEKPYGYFVILADNGLGFSQSIGRHLLRVSLSVSLPVLLLLFFISVMMSRSAISPAVDALKRQKQFISDAGHELKTPLSTIAVNAAVLDSEIGPNKYMDCIQYETQRMDVLVRQLLEVACLDDLEPSKRRESFSLSEVVYQATLPFESLAFEQNIRYTTDIQEHCTLRGDPERMRQVAGILLDNAFKYSRPGGEVSLRLHQEGHRILLEVYNTGDGIAPEDMPHIFERFYRCDKARTGNGSYGLGLAIAQSAVEAAGGEITAESEYGRWARFRVILRDTEF